MDQRTEAEIVLKVLRGDRQAYALLVDEYKTSIFNLAYRMTKNLEDAEDLAQEAFLRSYKELARYDNARSFYTWIYTISLNLIRNHLKKRGRQHTDAIHGTVESLPDVQELDESVSERREKVEICMLKLSPRMRELLILRFYQGLSFEAIAEITGFSQSAAKMRVYRGLEKLRKLIQKM